MSFYMNDVRAMAIDDECGLTHVPDTPSPYYGLSPDCGLTRTPHAMQLDTGGLLAVGLGTVLIASVLGALAVSFVAGYGFSKGTQYAGGVLRK